MRDRKQKTSPSSTAHPAIDRPCRHDKVVPIGASKLAATGPTPLPSDSLTRQLFGDLRGLLLIVRTGTLQNMHPDISAALVEHSNFFQNPWHRLLRSMPPILGVVYDGDRATCTGRQVRDFHRGIGGHSSGHAYHALNPELYYWAHATFFESQIALCDFFGTPLSAADKERLYQESIQWYALYGLTMAPVPPDYASFQRYWQQMIDTRLQNTTVTDWYFRNGQTVPAPYSWLRGPLWNWLLRPMVSGSSQWLAAGTLPPVLRERLGLAWTAQDERLLRLLGGITRRLWRVTPERWHYLPTARRAMQRAAKSSCDRTA